ncbi:MAG: hypothetical protein HYS12_02650 [Planctomycetes bacterium]|nr:hypothetical protein [Planctomycetota bacterium]
MRMRPSYLVFLLASAVLPFTLMGSGRTKGISDEEEGDKRKIVARGQAEDAGPFRFPDDEGGKLLARLLAPPENLPPLRTTEPRPRRGMKALENPAAPPPPQVVLLPRLTTEEPRRTLPPQLLTPELPLGGHEEPVVIPPPPSFLVGERLRVPSADGEKPVDLPPTAQPLPDRAPVADPTQSASREAVLSATMPARKSPAPFLRFLLPDPFEHRETVRLRTPLGTEQVPILFSAPPPRQQKP